MTEATLTAEQRGACEYADVNGIRLSFETHGPADAARTIVCLYGGLDARA